MKKLSMLKFAALFKFDKDHRAMKVKKYLLNQLSQFIPVVLGVYVGIIAGNWNENQVQRAAQAEFVKNLRLEIQANRAKVEETLRYRKTITDAVRKARKELSPKTMDAIFWSAGQWDLLPGWKGVHIPVLENSVYQSGVMTNALAGLEFSVINNISRAYNHQDDYKSYAHQLIFEKITQLDKNVTTAEVLTRLEVWQEIMGLEQNLLKQYDQTLKELHKLEYE